MKRRYSSQITAGFYSLLVILIVNISIEFGIETKVGENNLIKDLAIPISVAFGFLANIIIILNADLLKRLPGIENLVSKLDYQNKISSELFNNLKEEQINLQKIYSNLHSKNLMLKDFGNDMIKKYMNGFKINDEGITLVGEHWALSTYVQFWEYLALRQKEIKKTKSGKNIITRITHSNDINIWKSEAKMYRQYSEDCYMYQKMFTDNDGVIVRILLGKEEEPNESYKEVMKKMAESGVEVKYLSQEHISEKEFDFLFLADDGIVMKWFSGNKGQRLTKCTIVDRVDKSVIRTWAKLYQTLGDNGDDITSIPPDRQQ